MLAGLGSLETSLLGLQIAFFPCIHILAISSSFHKDTSRTGVGPTLMASFNFTLLKALVPKTVPLRVKTST